MRKYADLSAKNVDTEVVYEAYLKGTWGPSALGKGLSLKMGTHKDTYFMGNLKFEPVVMKDRNGKVIPNEFHAYANKEWWDHKAECPNIGVDITSIPNPLTGGSLWYVIDLKTVG
jgi:hypothetical protein